MPQTEIRPPNNSASLENAATSPSASVSAESAAAVETVFSFEPAIVSVARGQQVTLLLRGAGDTLTSDSIVVTFDPSVAAVTLARPVLAVNGVADARIERGRVTVRAPAGTSLNGTRAIAEITVMGIAPGRSILSVEGAGAGASAAIEVK